MRQVALAFAVLTLVAALPLGSANHIAGGSQGPLTTNDDCHDDITLGPEGGSSCLRIDLPAATPAQVRAQTGPRLFLWLGALDCPQDVACMTLARTPSDNMVTGERGLYPLLYGDTNSAEGLQMTTRQGLPPDELLLV